MVSRQRTINSKSLPKIEKRPSVAKAAYELIGGALVSGRFRPGEPIHSARLAAELGVSRGPVDEALRRLESEGFLEEAERRGYRIRELTPDDVVDLYNARVALESAALRLAKRRRASVEPLRASVRLMSRSIGTPTELSEAEFAFHKSLCDLSGNGYLVSAYEGLSARIRMALVVDNAEHLLYENPERWSAEHLKLVESIESWPEDEAVILLASHVTAALGALAHRLGARDEEGVVALAQRLLGPTEAFVAEAARMRQAEDANGDGEWGEN